MVNYLGLMFFSIKCKFVIGMVICLLTKHLRVHRNSDVEMCPCAPDQIGIWKFWFLRRGENRSTRRKTSRSKGENHLTTSPALQRATNNRVE